MEAVIVSVVALMLAGCVVYLQQRTIEKLNDTTAQLAAMVKANSVNEFMGLTNPPPVVETDAQDDKFTDVTLYTDIP